MYVPGLKKKFVSMSMLEDHGYDVIFSNEKAFLHDMENLYKLDVEYCVVLSTKAEKVQS